MTGLRGPRPWPTLGSGPIDDRGVFRVQSVTRRSPRTERVGDYQVLHMPNWVNVIATTPDDRVVLVSQYRHGIDDLTYEIPGGAVDPGEDEAVAAARELLEETGYAGAPAVLLGTVRPNPALQTNACSTWWIRDAQRVQAPALDEGEDIEVMLAARTQVARWAADGTIDHALVVAALYWWQCYDPSVPREVASTP